ncbi:Na(+)-translocating NADH-quinone reductase subunit B [Posidoniimonas polymericola]|uniref:Na(+)-translocating NADH-quinone reductase subunit B n=1 Tax=Posidoniimonas polymericola TaxID=2528002 RepID=A0A5C5XY41_9BACT|nr:NADH:ubiquinone reductase (Na(+)-transporting) subunit B [Posidoniimonas polymericola]TWT67608.1 Na(+)-translocating NADH-quinone reductase subunit B [Posidoniimonas polymericola]
MKFLRQQLDMIAPLFEKGGKLERLYPLYEAQDTFLFTPGETTKSASHVRDALDMKRMMSMVIVALGPCILMALYNTGLQANRAIAAGAAPIDSFRETLLAPLGPMVHDPSSIAGCFIHGLVWFLPVYIVTMAVGGVCELIFSLVRGHEINEGFLVTGMLFPLTLPPTIPLWQVGLGIAFGVVIGKEIFGGTGKNFLNPALTARAFLYFAYPARISGEWVASGASNIGVWVAARQADGISGATSLGEMVGAAQGQGPAEVMGGNYSWGTAFVGLIQGSMGETSALCCLLGAAILIASGIGSWRIMAGCVLGLLGTGFLFWGFRGSSDNPLTAIAPWWHLVIGGFAFGTVFMATDPVSAAMTEIGKWWYGILIGVMTVLIRVINPAFPEGIMLAILFGNTMAPLIDYFVIQANVKRRMARYAA